MKTAIKDNDYYVRYGAFLKRRFNTKEKIRFLGMIRHDFEKLGYDSEVKASKRGRKTICNLYVGDVQHADTIVTTYYDTPHRALGLYEYAPFDPERSASRKAMASRLPSVIIVLLEAVLLVLASQTVWGDGVMNLWDGVAALPIIILIVLLLRISKGLPNPYNIVRNTSSVLLILDLAERFRGRKGVAFCLVDDGCFTYEGYRSLQQDLNPETEVIALDVIAGKGQLYAGTSAAAHTHPFADAGHYPLPFPKGMLLASGQMKAGMIICPDVNSSKDIEMDEAHYQEVLEVLNTIMEYKHSAAANK